MRRGGIAWIACALIVFLVLPVLARAEDDGISPSDHRLRRFLKKPPAPRTGTDLAEAARVAQEIQSVRDTREQADSAKPANAPAPERERTAVERSESEGTVAKIATKLGRGIVNVLTGWIEFPKQIVQRTKSDGIGAGLSLGLLEGVGMTVVRTVGGAIEIVLFLAPLPGDYDPLLEPALVFH